MSKIINIGVLDVREIKEEIAKEITEIENVGLIIESDESQGLLSHAKKQNIGLSIKIPIDKDIKLILNNGNMKVDKDYLEGFRGTLAIVVNGELRFTEDITNQLIDEKIYTILVNGKLILPKSISGSVLSKATINGTTTNHKNDYIFFPGTTTLSNRFLKGFREKSKLSFEKLIVGEDLDDELLDEKLDRIEVMEKLIVLEKIEDKIFPFIDEYYAVEKEIIPYYAKGIEYIKGDIKLDTRHIQNYSRMALYVDGDVEINLVENIELKNHIVYLVCDKLILDKKTYSKIGDIIAVDVEVEIIDGRLLVNKGKMSISENFKDMVTIKNMGKLIIEDSVNVENIEKYLHSINNFGLIEAPAKLIGVLNNKTDKNYGKIREPLKSVKSEDKGQEKEKNDIMYSNMGELKL